MFLKTEAQIYNFEIDSKKLQETSECVSEDVCGVLNFIIKNHHKLEGETLKTAGRILLHIKNDIQSQIFALQDNATTFIAKLIGSIVNGTLKKNRYLKSYSSINATYYEFTHDDLIYGSGDFGELLKKSEIDVGTEYSIEKIQTHISSKIVGEVAERNNLEGTYELVENLRKKMEPRLDKVIYG